MVLGQQFMTTMTVSSGDMVSWTSGQTTIILHIYNSEKFLLVQNFMV